MKNALIVVILVSVVIALSCAIWATNERVNRFATEAEYREKLGVTERAYVDVKENAQELERVMQTSSDRWSKSYKEASDRAAMWLAKLGNANDEISAMRELTGKRVKKIDDRWVEDTETVR